MDGEKEENQRPRLRHEIDGDITLATDEATSMNCCAIGR
jgi:hypothetical protein